VLFGLVGGLLGALLALASSTSYPCAHLNANLLVLPPALLVLVPAGVWLAARRETPRRTLWCVRALLATAVAVILVDLVAHALGLAHQRHVAPALAVLAIEGLALAASRALDGVQAR
jgi:hypothetical protein